MHTGELVLQALEAIITNPNHEEHLIRKYFSSGYYQVVDGKRLNFDEFIKHMSLLKKETKKMTLIVIASASENDTVFTHHQVIAEKKNGMTASFEVLARFTLSDNKIISCEELTRLIRGNDSDEDLGSKH